jgi:hypothetical protein
MLRLAHQTSVRVPVVYRIAPAKKAVAGPVYACGRVVAGYFARVARGIVAKKLRAPFLGNGRQQLAHRIVLVSRHPSSLVDLCHHLAVRVVSIGRHRRDAVVAAAEPVRFVDPNRGRGDRGTHPSLRQPLHGVVGALQDSSAGQPARHFAREHVADVVNPTVAVEPGYRARPRHVALHLLAVPERRRASDAIASRVVGNLHPVLLAVHPLGLAHDAPQRVALETELAGGVGRGDRIAERALFEGFYRVVGELALHQLSGGVVDQVGYLARTVLDPDYAAGEIVAIAKLSPVEHLLSRKASTLPLESRTSCVTPPPGSMMRTAKPCVNGRPNGRQPSRPLPRVRGRSSDRISHFPRLVEQWHPTRKRRLLPGDVTYGSGKCIWWRCPNGSDHAHARLPPHRRRQLPLLRQSAALHHQVPGDALAPDADVKIVEGERDVSRCRRRADRARERPARAPSQVDTRTGIGPRPTRRDVHNKQNVVAPGREK